MFHVKRICRGRRNTVSNRRVARLNHCGQRIFEGLVADLDLERGFGAPDSLDAAFREHALGRHLEQAELERGAADVGNENLVRAHEAASGAIWQGQRFCLR